MYFFTSQTPPKKINKIIPRVANSSYRLFFRKKKSTRSFLEWPTLVIDSFSKKKKTNLAYSIFACLDFAHCKTFFFPAFSHSPQTSVTLFAFVGQDVGVTQFEIVAGVLHTFCFVSLNIIR